MFEILTSTEIFVGTRPYLDHVFSLTLESFQ